MKPLYSTTVPLSVFCGSLRAICDNFLCTPVHTTVEMLSPPNLFSPTKDILLSKTKTYISWFLSVLTAFSASIGARKTINELTLRTPVNVGQRKTWPALRRCRQLNSLSPEGTGNGVIVCLRSFNHKNQTKPAIWKSAEKTHTRSLSHWISSNPKSSNIESEGFLTQSWQIA